MSFCKHPHEDFFNSLLPQSKPYSEFGALLDCLHYTNTCESNLVGVELFHLSFWERHTIVRDFATGKLGGVR